MPARPRASRRRSRGAAASCYCRFQWHPDKRHACILAGRGADPCPRPRA
jgi:hypothetical protein